MDKAVTAEFSASVQITYVIRGMPDDFPKYHDLTEDQSEALMELEYLIQSKANELLKSFEISKADEEIYIGVDWDTSVKVEIEKDQLLWREPM